jgi:hypothetical protein
MTNDASGAGPPAFADGSVVRFPHDGRTGCLDTAGATGSIPVPPAKNQRLTDNSLNPYGKNTENCDVDLCSRRRTRLERSLVLRSEGAHPRRGLPQTTQCHFAASTPWLPNAGRVAHWSQ